MNVLSKAIITHKEELYKKSAAEIAIGACLLTIDDLLPFLFRKGAEQVMQLDDDLFKKANEITITEEMRRAFFEGYAEIMNYYAGMDGKNAVKYISEELGKRGINAVVGFRG